MREGAELPVKSQNRTPFEKAVDALGIGKMATHQEQIDALTTLAANKSRGDGIRNDARVLAEKWRADMPAKPVEPVPIEKTEAAAVKTDAQVAREPEGTPTRLRRRNCRPSWITLLQSIPKPGLATPLMR